jgi:hypothetical protein
MDHSKEVLDVVLPSVHESAEVVHPGEEPLHFPAPLVASQGPSVLCFGAVAAIGCDHLDAVLVFQSSVESVGVVGLVADQSRWEFVEEAASKDFFDKLALCRRSALDRYGEWKTVISGDSDDLRTLAATGGADGKAPFLALAKVASTNASSRFSLPCSCNSRASSRSASTSLPSRIHCWNRRWQVWYGGYFSGSSRHCAPVLSTQKTPFSTARESCHGRPRRTAGDVGRSTGSINVHCSSVNSQRPFIPVARRHQSNSRMNQICSLGNYETGSRGARAARPLPRAWLLTVVDLALDGSGRRWRFCAVRECCSRLN